MMLYDSGAKGLDVETGRGSATYTDRPTPTVGVLKSVKADGFVRSKANGCFPEVTGQPYQALKDDIRKNGQLCPILVHGKEVVDGWTRYWICRELDMEVQVLEVSAQDGVRATLSSQFNRGHFSQLQKAAIIRDAVETMGRGRPKKESEADPLLDNLAKEYGVSKSYLKLVSRAKREKPEWMEDIKLGKITFSQLKARFKKTRPEQAAKPDASENPPEPAEKSETVVDQDLTLVSDPDAAEVLKIFRRILARLPKEEKPLFKDATEPVCDFLDINLN